MSILIFKRRNRDMFANSQVDVLEAEAKALEGNVRGVGRVEEKDQREQIRLIELVTQAQIEMDGIKVRLG